MTKPEKKHAKSDLKLTVSVLYIVGIVPIAFLLNCIVPNEHALLAAIIFHALLVLCCWYVDENWDRSAWRK